MCDCFLSFLRQKSHVSQDANFRNLKICKFEINKQAWKDTKGFSKEFLKKCFKKMTEERPLDTSAGKGTSANN